MTDKPGNWIDDVEVPDAQVKWAFSHFDGRQDTFNDEGEHNFTIMLPEKDAMDLREIGWAIREKEGFEEGDPPEFLLKVKISDRFDLPKMFLIKNDRKFRVESLRDLHDITRGTCEQLDVIITPSRWVNGANTGISAYVKELYAKVKESRFAADYADYEEVR